MSANRAPRCLPVVSSCRISLVEAAGLEPRASELRFEAAEADLNIYESVKAAVLVMQISWWGVSSKSFGHNHAHACSGMI